MFDSLKKNPKPNFGRTASGLQADRAHGVGVRRGDLVDNSQIGALAPEFGKPAADNGLRAAT